MRLSRLTKEPNECQRGSHCPDQKTLDQEWMREGEITGSLTHTCYHPCHPPPPNLLVPKSKYQLLPIWFWVLSLLTHHILKCCPQTKLLNWSPLPSFPLMQCGNGWVILFGMRSSDWPVTCQPPGGSSSSPYRNTLGSSSSSVMADAHCASSPPDW